MAGSREKQIAVLDGIYYRMGASLETDGITFSAAVPAGEAASLLLYRKGQTDPVKEIPFPENGYSGSVRTVKVSGISSDQYEYNFKIGSEIVTDPAARLVLGRRIFADSVRPVSHQVRGAFPSETFDWGEDRCSLDLPCEDIIAYHLHVRGFTRQKNSKVRHKGTFLGLQEKIPYLKELGVNQVILMPAYEFDEIMKEEPPVGSNGVMQETIERLNYWGYIPGYYYAPKLSYSASGDPVREFKQMVRAFHENEIEVIMEFAFPDPADPVMAADCLAWWVQEYHVDGFSLLMDQNAVRMLTRYPVLSASRFYAGYVPSDYMGRRQNTKRRFSECNDSFKVTARRLLKGDEGQLSAFVDRVRYNPEEKGILNYMTGHDGFTLMDLVSYDKKHNEENGEQGRDGSPCDYSWNCGIEGPTKKRLIMRLRMRQMKNAFAMMLLAQGTPMLLAGDEFGNSQNGNNNPYCHDSELTWVDWSREKSMQELTLFVKELVQFRKTHRILHMPHAFTGSDTLSCGYPDFSCHGSRAWYGDFEYQNRHVGLMYCGKYADEDGFLYVGYNFHWDTQGLALPHLPDGMCWKQVLSTADEEIQVDGKELKMPGRSIVVLESVSEKEKAEDSKEKSKDSKK